MAIPFSFLVSWAKAHKSEDSSLTYVRTLEQKNLFQTIEEIVSSNDTGKKISDLRAFITARFNDIQMDYQNANGRQPVVLGDVPDTEAFVNRLKAFLQDFSLLNERSMMEVGLWDQYMIYAEFFGLADQVRKEMTKIWPEYAQLSNITKISATVFVVLAIVMLLVK